MICSAAALWVATLAPLAAQAQEESTAPDETPAGSAEDAEVKASPEVQKQVGMGTEKDAPQQDHSTTTPAASDREEPPADEESDFGHFGQFGVRVGYTPGYKVQLRFEDSPPCPQGDSGEGELDVCGYGTAGALDFALSFALLDAIEPYLWFRLGLGEDTTSKTEADQYFGAGLRIYTMSDSRLKLFFEPALAIATQGATADAPTGADERKYDTDIVVHLHFGLQYDFAKYVGMYASLGPNVAFVRAIATELGGTIGLQARFP